MATATEHIEPDSRSVPEIERAASEWLRDPERSELKTRWEQCYGDKSEAMRTLAGDLGERYWGCELENYCVYDDAQQQVLDKLRWFADSMRTEAKGGGLLLFGKPGTGKDHLIAALLKIAVSKWRMTARWFDGGNLFDRIYYATKSETDNELKNLHELLCGSKAPHVLAISDPQPIMGDMNPNHARRLRDIVDRRYRRSLSTWFTTNLANKPEMERFLGEPVVDRLREHGGLVICDWESYRPKVRGAWMVGEFKDKAAH